MIDGRWMAERLDKLRVEDHAAYAEIVGLYPETVGRLDAGWESLSSVEQSARRMLADELTEADA